MEARTREAFRRDTVRGWLTAYYGRVEKMPPLKDELARLDGAKSREQPAVLEGERAVGWLKAMTLAMGGVVEV